MLSRFHYCGMMIHVPWYRGTAYWIRRRHDTQTTRSPLGRMESRIVAKVLPLLVRQLIRIRRKIVIQAKCAKDFRGVHGSNLYLFLFPSHTNASSHLCGSFLQSFPHPLVPAVKGKLFHDSECEAALIVAI